MVCSVKAALSRHSLGTVSPRSVLSKQKHSRIRCARPRKTLIASRLSRTPNGDLSPVPIASLYLKACAVLVALRAIDAEGCLWRILQAVAKVIPLFCALEEKKGEVGDCELRFTTLEAALLTLDSWNNHRKSPRRASRSLEHSAVPVLHFTLY